MPRDILWVSSRMSPFRRRAYPIIGPTAYEAFAQAVVAKYGYDPRSLISAHDRVESVMARATFNLNDLYGAI